MFSEPLFSYYQIERQLADNAFVEGMMPVSYTHLDVYKRQEEDGSLLFREYRIKLEAAEETRRKAGGCLRELYLELPFEGDRAEAYLGGRLIADWFTNGETWRAALRRYGFPQELMVRVYDSGRPIPNPYGNRVYYDLPVVPGCALGKIRLLREYEIEI